MALTPDQYRAQIRKFFTDKLDEWFREVPVPDYIMDQELATEEIKSILEWLYHDLCTTTTDYDYDRD